MHKLSSKRKLQSFCFVTVAGCCTFAGFCIYKSNEKFYRDLVMPVVRILDPEKAHKFAVFLSEHRLVPKSNFKDPDVLKITVFGKEFPNPIGVAAGFDKDGKAIMGLKDIGFGFIEVGSVTPQPQPGNPQPRVFRLKEDLAVINRYGFNSEGHEEVYQRLATLRQQNTGSCIVGVNLGKNKTSTDAIADYVEGVKKFSPVSDYLVINISSPNTPNLRNLQNKNDLANLLKAIIEARNNLHIDNKPPLLLKLAPDLSYDERKDIAKVIMQKDCRVDGLIICNTTIDRPLSLMSDNKSEIGGLSGKPLNEVSTKMIADMSKLTNGMPIIGVGGISTGKDAYEKIKAGASLIQIYSIMVYDGPPIVTKIKKELLEYLKKDGYKNIAEAVGVDVR